MITSEKELENHFLAKLVDLKYTSRPDIRDCVTLEQNFRDKFQALNRVNRPDGEFARFLDEKNLDRQTCEKFNKFQGNCVKKHQHRNPRPPLASASSTL